MVSLTEVNTYFGNLWIKTFQKWDSWVAVYWYSGPVTSVQSPVLDRLRDMLHCNILLSA